MNLSNYKLNVLFSAEFGDPTLTAILSVIYIDKNNPIYKINKYLFICEELYSLYGNKIFTGYPYSFKSFYMGENWFSLEEEQTALIKINNLLKQTNMKQDLINIYEQLLNKTIFDIST